MWKNEERGGATSWEYETRAWLAEKGTGMRQKGKKKSFAAVQAVGGT